VTTETDTAGCFSSSQFTVVQWAVPGSSAAVNELYAILEAARV
jgi:hypothetical protein